MGYPYRHIYMRRVSAFKNFDLKYNYDPKIYKG